MALSPLDQLRQIDDAMRERERQRQLSAYYSAMQNQLGPPGQALNGIGQLGSLGGLLGSSPFDPVPLAPPPIDKNAFLRLQQVEPRRVLRPAPDFIAPLVAWRAWKVSDGKLSALGRSEVWEPKQAMEAKCGDSKREGAPHRDCGCGIWSFTSLDTLLDKLGGYTTKVIGQVSIWGRVIECEFGFRSQFAYPKELWLLDPEMERLGYTYGVPVRTP